MPDRLIHIEPDLERAAAWGADLVRQVLTEAAQRRGRASIALAGGSTPVAIYRQLKHLGTASLPWDRVAFFFGDERAVPPTSPESNFRMAADELLVPLGIAPAMIHRIQGEDPDITRVAAQYEALLHTELGAGPFTFDLVLLGVGTDGHTASLFPGSTALDATTDWVRAVEAPPSYPTRSRISLTLPVLNGAENVMVFAAGAGKREIVATALRQPAQTPPLPIQRIAPRPPGRLQWLLDGAAAGLLPDSRPQTTVLP